MAVLAARLGACNTLSCYEKTRNPIVSALLTTELKDDLQTNGQTVMSVEALKKAELIEKLAHSVKSKMKQLY